MSVGRKVRGVWIGEELGAELTTLRVPIRTLGGVLSAETISEMKFAVMPIMEIRQTACMPRTTVNVIPSAP